MDRPRLFCAFPACAYTEGLFLQLKISAMMSTTASMIRVMEEIAALVFRMINGEYTPR